MTNVKATTLLLVTGSFTFGALLALKTPLEMSSGAFQMTLFALVAYQAIAIFSRSFDWWRRMAGFCVAAGTYVLTLSALKHVFIELYATGMLGAFVGFGIADALAFVAGIAVQLALTLRWQNKLKNWTMSTSPCCFLLSSGERAAASLRGLSGFQFTVVALLMLNAFISYQAWTTADAAVWEASEAHTEAQSGAGLASDALDVAKEGAEQADLAYKAALLCR